MPRDTHPEDPKPYIIINQTDDGSWQWRLFTAEGKAQAVCAEPFATFLEAHVSVGEFKKRFRELEDEDAA